MLSANSSLRSVSEQFKTWLLFEKDYKVFRKNIGKGLLLLFLSGKYKMIDWKEVNNNCSLENARSKINSQKPDPEVALS